MSEQPIPDSWEVRPSERASPNLQRETLQAFFESATRHAFAGLDSIKSESKPLGRIRWYRDELLEQRLTALETPAGLSPALTLHYLDQIPTGNLEPTFQNLIRRLNHETDYFAELDEVGIPAALAVGGLENGRFAARVKFLPPESARAVRLRSKDILALYRPPLNVAVVPNQPPSPVEMWFTLASSGILPNTISSLDHELTHETQVSETQRRLYQTGIIGTFGGAAGSIVPVFPLGIMIGSMGATIAGTTILKVANSLNDPTAIEVHAYDAKFSNRVYAREEETDRNRTGYGLARHLISSYPDIDDILRVQRAYRDLRLLRHLIGPDDRVIGRIVAGASYDPDSKSFPKFRREIDRRLRDTWKVQETDVTILARVLEAMDQTETTYQQHLAQDISVEELKIAAGIPISRKDRSGEHNDLIPLQDGPRRQRDR